MDILYPLVILGILFIGFPWVIFHYITRWKTLGILITTLVVCLFVVPNFLPEKMVQGWAKRAQRHIVLGLDLQGGSHILLEVETRAVRKEKLETLRDDVLRVVPGITALMGFNIAIGALLLQQWTVAAVSSAIGAVGVVMLMRKRGAVAG